MQLLADGVLRPALGQPQASKQLELLLYLHSIANDRHQPLLHDQAHNLFVPEDFDYRMDTQKAALSKR